MTESIPISVIERSEKLLQYIQSYISTLRDKTIYVADFAAGENDEVPLFFLQRLPPIFLKREPSFRLFIYCTDAHTLRIESLFEKLVSLDFVEQSRVVFAKLETMTEKAEFPAIQMEYIEHAHERTWIDELLLQENRIPKESFHIGILNNDVVGYLHAYYTEYTDAKKSLQGIRNVMRDDGLLIVTQPCMLFPLDNIQALESNGFQYLTGFNFDLRRHIVSDVAKDVSPVSLSKMGHYTILLFKCI